MKPGRSSGSAAESLQVLSAGPSREQLDPAGPKLQVFPESPLLAPGCGSLRAQPPGARFQVGRHLLRIALGRKGADPPRPARPLGASAPPGHPCPGGARCHSPRASSPASPRATQHPGALRARPPLTLRRSGPSPQRPPGLRFPAAGVGGAGRGKAGAWRVPAGWPHKGEAGAPPGAPFNARPRSLRPARSLKAERRLGSPRLGTGTGNDLSRLQPPTAPLRWARPWAVSPFGWGAPPALAPSSLRRLHRPPQGTVRAPPDLQA